MKMKVGRGYVLQRDVTYRDIFRDDPRGDQVLYSKGSTWYYRGKDKDTTTHLTHEFYRTDSVDYVSLNPDWFEVPSDISHAEFEKKPHVGGVYAVNTEAGRIKIVDVDPVNGIQIATPQGKEWISKTDFNRMSPRMVTFNNEALYSRRLI